MQGKRTIKELIDEVRLELHKNRYTELTIAAYETRWRIFKRYATEKRVKFFTTEFGLTFLKEKCDYVPGFPLKETQRAYVRTINMIDEYDKYGFISTKRLSRKLYAFPEGYTHDVQTYISRRKQGGLSESRIKSYKICLERFTAYLNSEGVHNFSELQCTHVDNFIESLCQHTASTAANMLGCLRSFLAYLREESIIDNDLSVLVPTVRRSGESTIPSAFTKKEVERLLQCVDRAGTKGKRNYAMLVLAARLGLRSSDICSLEMDSLKWGENAIEIKQAKTKKYIRLPLLNEVGDAIIDYLRHRPKTDSKTVFIRLVPPFERLDNHSLYTIMGKYIKRAGINVKPGRRHGPHALRHSLSSIMLENEVPLPVISDILSHSSSETTKIYLKIDIGRLRECSLDAPALSNDWKEVAK